MQHNLWQKKGVLQTNFSYSDDSYFFLVWFSKFQMTLNLLQRKPFAGNNFYEKCTNKC